MQNRTFDELEAELSPEELRGISYNFLLTLKGYIAQSKFDLAQWNLRVIVSPVSYDSVTRSLKAIDGKPCACGRPGCRRTINAYEEFGHEFAEDGLLRQFCGMTISIHPDLFGDGFIAWRSDKQITPELLAKWNDGLRRMTQHQEVEEELRREGYFV